MAQFSLMSIEELKSKGADELARLLKASEQERLRTTADSSRTMKEVNKKLQAHVLEIRSLQELNRELQMENEELRDLCCFLDTGRLKDQRLMHEWQKFGQYTSAVMQTDVSTFQSKLSALETKLESLMKENIELKELCLLLADDKTSRCDRENLLNRDAGDGSSSSSPSTEKLPLHSNQIPPHLDDGGDRNSAAVNDETVQYLRYLESRVSNLEQENARLSRNQNYGDVRDYRKFVLTAEPSGSLQKSTSSSHPRMVGTAFPNRQQPPEYSNAAYTVQSDNANATRVMNHRDQLDRSNYGMASDNDVMGESEKAIFRQMCNVVWQKLGGAVPGYKTAV